MPSSHLPWRTTTKVTGVVASLCLLLAGAACGSSTPEPAASTPPKDVKVAGSVVTTAGSSNEMDVVVPGPVEEEWAALGSKGLGVELVKVAGDGTATREPADLTGDAAAQVAALAEAMNAFDATAPGRSALSGLSSIKSSAADPVWVFSPMLDTKAPLNFTQLAFDESPTRAVKTIQKAGKLPNLKGRQVTFVVTPVAGEQEKLSKLQVGYQRAIWENLAKASGAKKVTFFDGTGTTPGAGTIPAIPVQKPDDEINAQQRDARTTTCTLPSPALFVSDQAALIDKGATLKALKKCVGNVKPTTKITVEGHTAGVAGEDNEFAKDLSTRRATEVAALLRELKVPAKNITKVVGYGSTKPIVEPSSDPKNRAVVVAFTTSE
ncbi:MAG TPA: OmpA family protein [Propionibacteriaceae bacterium]|nr:OmpA family protein [Propionibacteriaceae bacterium]